MQQATVRREYGAHMLMALELALLPNVLDHEGIDESENPNEWHDWAISEASSRTVNARKSWRGDHTSPASLPGPCEPSSSVHRFGAKGRCFSSGWAPPQSPSNTPHTIDEPLF